MARTPYNHYSDKELLSAFDDKREHSDVIDELCNRLEQFVDKGEKQYQAECPVCDATLDVSFNDDEVTLET